MGFGREKTVYTYFAVASCSLFPHNSVMRLLIAKAAIIVTVADDFYDMEASLPELEILTLAVQRYDTFPFRVVLFKPFTISFQKELINFSKL